MAKEIKVSKEFESRIQDSISGMLTNPNKPRPAIIREASLENANNINSDNEELFDLLDLKYNTPPIKLEA